MQISALHRKPRAKAVLQQVYLPVKDGGRMLQPTVEVDLRKNKKITTHKHSNTSLSEDKVTK